MTANSHIYPPLFSFAPLTCKNKRPTLYGTTANIKFIERYQEGDGEIPVASLLVTYRQSKCSLPDVSSWCGAKAQCHNFINFLLCKERISKPIKL